MKAWFHAGIYRDVRHTIDLVDIATSWKEQRVVWRDQAKSLHCVAPEN
jgi:hypothetical protein